MTFTQLKTPKNTTEKWLFREIKLLMAEHTDIFLLYSKLKKAIALRAASHKTKNIVLEFMTIDFEYDPVFRIRIQNKIPTKNGGSYAETTNWQYWDIAEITLSPRQ